jgi:hypothetical protein
MKDGIIAGSSGVGLSNTFRDHHHPPRLDGLHILRYADDAVRKKAAKVGVDEMLGHNAGCVRRHAQRRIGLEKVNEVFRKNDPFAIPFDQHVSALGAMEVS